MCNYLIYMYYTFSAINRLLHTIYIVTQLSLLLFFLSQGSEKRGLQMSYGHSNYIQKCIWLKDDRPPENVLL